MTSQQLDLLASSVRNSQPHHIRRKPVNTTLQVIGLADDVAKRAVTVSQQLDPPIISTNSMDNAQQPHIHRKPVNIGAQSIASSDAPSQYVGIVSTQNKIFASCSSSNAPLNTDLAENEQNFPANLRQPPDLSTEMKKMSSSYQSGLLTQVERFDPSAELAESPQMPMQNEILDPSSAKSTGAYFQKAYQDARHRLGGLIQRPTESTKHYTILRHSHGIIFYNGSHTYLTISIFADASLPLDRMIWLQNKGWTGKTGMKAKALFGFNSTWVNVTPTTAIQPTQVPPTEERAWQRDITKFQRKAPLKISQQHLLRETCIVRVPPKVEDGYFQIVLSRGDNKKKVLCRSPVFRVLSTSLDMSIFRGASLTTFPFELGAYIAGLHAKTAISTWASQISSPIKNLVQPYMPSSSARHATSIGWSASGLQKRIDCLAENTNNQFNRVLGQVDASENEEDVNLESGPQPPYPFSFKAKLDYSCGNCISSAGIQTVHLTKVPKETTQRLHGCYFGWCRFGKLPEEQKFATDIHEFMDSWEQVVIYALTVDESTIANVKAYDAFQRKITLRFIEELDLPGNATVEVQIMGFIRLQQSFKSSPFIQATKLEDESAVEAAAATVAEEHLMLETLDASITESMLGHPAWAPDRVSKLQTACLGHRIQDTYVKMRVNSEKIMGRVPVHKVGVRGPLDIEKDQLVSVNGFYIVRDLQEIAI